MRYTHCISYLQLPSIIKTKGTYDAHTPFSPRPGRRSVSISPAHQVLPTLCSLRQRPWGATVPYVAHLPLLWLWEISMKIRYIKALKVGEESWLCPPLESRVFLFHPQVGYQQGRTVRVSLTSVGGTKYWSYYYSTTIYGLVYCPECSCCLLPASYDSPIVAIIIPVGIFHLPCPSLPGQRLSFEQFHSVTEDNVTSLRLFLPPILFSILSSIAGVPRIAFPRSLLGRWHSNPA